MRADIENVEVASQLRKLHTCALEYAIFTVNEEEFWIRELMGYLR